MGGFVSKYYRSNPIEYLLLSLTILGISKLTFYTHCNLPFICLSAGTYVNSVVTLGFCIQK